MENQPVLLELVHNRTLRIRFHSRRGHWTETYQIDGRIDEDIAADYAANFVHARIHFFAEQSDYHPTDCFNWEVTLKD